MCRGGGPRAQGLVRAGVVHTTPVRPEHQPNHATDPPDYHAHHDNAKKLGIHEQSTTEKL